MPLKWKIFRFINFIHAGSSIAVFLILLWDFHVTPIKNIFYQLIFVFLCLLSLSPAVNGCFNIYLIEKSFPDKDISKRLRRVTLLFLVVDIIVILLMLTLFVFAFSVIISPEYRRNPVAYRGYLTLGILFITISTGLYIFWMQIILRRTIRRNFIKSFDSFLKN